MAGLPVSGGTLEQSGEETAGLLAHPPVDTGRKLFLGNHGDVVERHALRGHIVALPIAGQKLTAGFPQNVPAVLCGTGAEGDPCVKVDLDLCGDDLSKGALGGEDDMHTSGPAYLGKALDQRLHLLFVGGHEVGKLVDHNVDLATVPFLALLPLHSAVSVLCEVHGVLDSLHHLRGL